MRTLVFPGVALPENHRALTQIDHVSTRACANSAQAKAADWAWVFGASEGAGLHWERIAASASDLLEESVGAFWFGGTSGSFLGQWGRKQIGAGGRSGFFRTGLFLLAELRKVRERKSGETEAR